MLSYLVLLALITMCVVFESKEIDKIPVVHWKDLDSALSKWMESQPFRIKHSPLSQWKLTSYLQQNSVNVGNKRIKSYFERDENTNEMDEKFSFVKTQSRSSNCCFTDSAQFCKQIVSSFMYNSFGNRLEFWDKYEKNYQQIKQFKSCTNITLIENREMDSAMNELYKLKQDEIDNNIKKSIYMNANIPHKMYNDMNMQPFFERFSIDTKYGDWEIYLWIGSENGFASRHYDTTNNLFFVLRGSKQFLLSPPSLSKFKMYPSLHSSWRQQISSFNFDEIYENETLIFNVILNAGEVLYIPPFWYHKVKNLNVSTIGTNLWWYSQIHEKIDAIWSISIPIQNYWNVYKKYNEMMYFIYKLLDIFDKDLSFVSKNYFSTYPILYEMRQYLLNSNLFYVDQKWKWMELFVDIRNIQKCLNVNAEKISIPTILHQTYSCIDTEIEQVSKWKSSINSLYRMFGEVNSDGAKDIILAELIEKLIAFSINGDDVPLLPLLVAFGET